MSGPEMNTKTWAMGVMVIGLSGLVGYSLSQGRERYPAAAQNKVIPSPSATLPSVPASTDQADARTPDTQTETGGTTDVRSGRKPPDSRVSDAGSNGTTAVSEASAVAPNSFTPPPEDAIPDDDFGRMVRRGEAIFDRTVENAGQFVGNDLSCSNCHIDKGRLAGSAPLWAAYVMYPAYRSKNEHVNTFEERLQGCFKYSMNGKAPPPGDEVLVALQSYAYFLAKGAPTGVDLPGRGYPDLPKTDNLDRNNGRSVFVQKCSICHGDDGAGQKSADGTMVFPPLWGSRSYNWGAGMSTITNAAKFIKANMPLGMGNSLSDKEAWDVAAYIDSQERPQDPRFTGSVEETRMQYHNTPMSMYGKVVDGQTLGEKSPPSGLQAPQ